mmetsp:Transcript_36971/g.80276  ORF Transcript_36971/g.80276 Transcript_36971/m.80276 type:complete len:87 (-) Transcript_36971:54-314(-)
MKMSKLRCLSLSLPLSFSPSLLVFGILCLSGGGKPRNIQGNGLCMYRLPFQGANELRVRRLEARKFNNFALPTAALSFFSRNIFFR